jgi:hypothetical protein
VKQGGITKYNRLQLMLSHLDPVTTEAAEVMMDVAE